MKRDMPIAVLILLLGLVIGLWIGWVAGWRVGAREGVSMVLCVTARASGESFDEQAVNYCANLDTPIADAVTRNAAGELEKVKAR